MKRNKNNKNKFAILEKAKKIVRKDGWNEKIINKLLDQDVSASDLVFFFKNDYKEILNFSLDDLNLILEHRIKKINIINFPTNKRIKKILMERMKIIHEDKAFFKKTFNHILLPQNFKIMKKNLYKTTDSMWYLAGDNSTDFNYYTKRLILSFVYINCLFVLFNKDIKDVELVIDENLKKISKIPKLKDRLSILKDNLPFFLKNIIN